MDSSFRLYEIVAELWTGTERLSLCDLTCNEEMKYHFIYSKFSIEP